MDDLTKLNNNSKDKEELLEKIVKSSIPLSTFPMETNFLILAREWNSWYPSAYKVVGGCYFFNINNEIIIIDPGFNTLEIIRNNYLDIRLIRHVIVTHFHPDHFENLIKLLTRLTSSENKITLYLNPTTFRQFQIYFKNETEFIELKPDLNIKIKSQKNEYEVKLHIGKAFHREIGGSMDSIGLKIILKNQVSNREFRIGFMSDTDGSKEYIDYYRNFYDDCEIVIPHLGAIHKKPTGYSHLYLEGVENLLKILKKENKIIFLSEFGFELVNDKKFIDITSEIIPKITNYQKLIENIYNFLLPENNQSESSKLSDYQQELIGKLFSRQFELYIQKINPFYLSIEMILPILGLNRMFKIKEITYDEMNEKMGPFFKHFSNFEDLKEEYEEVWWKFLKNYVFQVHDNTDPEKAVSQFLIKLIGSEEFNNFNHFVDKFINSFSQDFKKYLLEKLILTLVGHINSKDIKTSYQYIQIFNNVSDLYPENFLIPEEYLPYEFFSNFPGINKKLYEFFERSKNNKLFFLLFYVYFIIKLRKIPSTKDNIVYLDGRKTVCNYLYKKTGHYILPGHPSFKILFDEKELKLEGCCSHYSHRSKIKIKEFNKNWEVHLEREHFNKMLYQPEYINIIPDELCLDCQSERDYVEAQMPSKEEIDEATEFYLEKMEKAKIEFEKTLFSAENLEDLLMSIKELDYESIEVSDESLLDKLEKLIQNTPMDKIDLTKELINPFFLKISRIKDIIFNRLDNIDKVVIKEIIMNLISKKRNFELFEDSNLINFISFNFKKFDKEEKFEIILDIADYFTRKRESKIRIKNLKFYRFFKNVFKKNFFILIESPNDNISIYNLLQQRFASFETFNEFELLFKIYYRTINSYLRYLRLDGKLI